MRIFQRRNFWEVAIAIGAASFLLNSVLFIYLGRANADEGWYLYASKLVYEGQLPYRDFAYTQTPLLPYIYGIAQKIFSPSLYLGRVTSVIFSVCAFLLSLQVAVRYGGKTAGGIASLLGGTFLFGIYYQSITKTYALTTFFFMSAFYILSSREKQDWRFILSTISVILAALTRLSALFFAIPFIPYAFFFSSIKIKMIITALCIAAISWILYIALPNLDAAIWGLTSYHYSQWGDISIIDRILRVLEITVPTLLKQFPCYFLLWATLLFLGFGRIRNYLGRHSAVLITITGLLLFTIPNLLTGGYLVEYFVPLIFTSFPIVGIAYEKLIYRNGRLSIIVLTLVFIAAIVMGFMRSRFTLYDLSGGQAPIEEIRQVSAVVVEHSTPGDKLFALEALWIAIESHRQVVPNMTMAQFSFSDIDTGTADRLHLVNGPIICEYFENHIPKLVILTDLDWDIWQSSPYYERIAASLKKNYRLVYSRDDFGQRDIHVDVFLDADNNEILQKNQGAIP